MKKTTILSAAIAMLLSGADALACTNLIAAKGATADGSVMMSYSADSHNLYGALHHSAAGKHAPGTMRKVYEWDTNKYLGEIP